MQQYDHHRSMSRRIKTIPKFIGVQRSPDAEISQGYNLAICDGRMEYTDKTSHILLKETKIQLQYTYLKIL
jgi:hypothetical protein